MPIETDRRLLRFHPDALPTHRRCPACPSGRDIHPLDALHFYERKTRFAWNDSRFTTLCREHHKAQSSANYRKDPAARNTVTTQRRQVTRRSMKSAALFYTPHWVTKKLQDRAASLERKERLALGKRRLRRLAGPYDPQRDGVKLLIQQRSRMYFERRLLAERTAATRGDQGTHGEPQDPQDARGAAAAHASAWLEEERQRNRELYGERPKMTKLPFGSPS